MCVMADHYKASIDALADVSLYCDELDLAYEAGASSKTVGDLHRRLGVALKIAGIHATLAQVQAMEERALVR